jgi:hypothetical protein
MSIQSLRGVIDILVSMATKQSQKKEVTILQEKAFKI